MNTTIEKDFGDWLSPMLVKEIRQGFRSRVFVLAFLLIQGLMIFCVVLGLIFSVGDFTDTSSGFFWTIVCIPLLLIMPSHGFGVLGNEIKGNTMELLFLTRLSSWRIVAGKWTAIVAQTILIVCSVLPYMVLRYFIGGVNLLEDLQHLGWLLFGSTILTATTIAISPYYRSMLAKLFLPIVTLVMVIIIIARISSFSPAGGFDVAHPFLIAAVMGPFFLLLMFEIAVARIAPPAENHSFRKRFLGLLILGAIAVLNMFDSSSGGTSVLMTIGVVLLLPVCVTSLCEEIKQIPSIYLPFVKRGFLGRMAGTIFYPGWSAGLFFTIIAFAVYLFIFFGFKVTMEQHNLLLVVSMAGGLLMPLAVEKAFFSKFNKTLIVYFSVQIFMAVTSILAASVGTSSLSGWKELASPLPTSTLILGIFNGIDATDEPLYILMGAVVLIASLIILLVKCLGPRREIAAMEKIARDTLMKPAEPEIAHASAA